MVGFLVIIPGARCHDASIAGSFTKEDGASRPAGGGEMKGFGSKLSQRFSMIQ